MPFLTRISNQQRHSIQFDDLLLLGSSSYISSINYVKSQFPQGVDSHIGYTQGLHPQVKRNSISDGRLML